MKENKRQYYWMEEINTKIGVVYDLELKKSLDYDREE